MITFFIDNRHLYTNYYWSNCSFCSTRCFEGTNVHHDTPILILFLSLQGTIGETLNEVQPTFFFGVPQVFEKFMEAIQAKVASVKGFKKKVGKWATKKGIKGNYRRQSRLVTFKYFMTSEINLG